MVDFGALRTVEPAFAALPTPFANTTGGDRQPSLNDGQTIQQLSRDLEA